MYIPRQLILRAREVLGLLNAGPGNRARPGAGVRAVACGRFALPAPTAQVHRQQLRQHAGQHAVRPASEQVRQSAAAAVRVHPVLPRVPEAPIGANAAARLSTCVRSSLVSRAPVGRFCVASFCRASVNPRAPPIAIWPVRASSSALAAGSRLCSRHAHASTADGRCVAHTEVVATAEGIDASALHNAYRTLHKDTPDLSYDATLAAGAQAFASQCQFTATSVRVHTSDPSSQLKAGVCPQS